MGSLLTSKLFICVRSAVSTYDYEHLAFFLIDSDTSVFSRTRSIGRNRMHGAIAGLKAPISIRILNLR